MLKTAKYLLAIAAFAAALCVSISGNAAFAAPDDEGDFSMSVPGVRMLTLDRRSLEFSPGGPELEAGFSEHKVVVASISANAEWMLVVSGSAAAWQGPWAKPVEDIQWRYGGGQYASLTMNEASVVSGGAQSKRSYPVHFRIKLDWENDVPGEYRYEYVMFQLTTP